MIYLKQTLKISAYEGARVALVPTSEEENVLACCNSIFDARGVNGATISVTPTDFHSQPTGTAITVEVSAPCESNSLFLSWLQQGRVMTTKVVMMKET